MTVSLLTLRRRGNFDLDNFLPTESKARYINHIMGAGGLDGYAPPNKNF